MPGVGGLILGPAGSFPDGEGSDSRSDTTRISRATGCPMLCLRLRPRINTASKLKGSGRPGKLVQVNTQHGKLPGTGRGPSRSGNLGTRLPGRPGSGEHHGS